MTKNFGENENMGSRTDWLTETSKPIADKLYAQLGSLKRVLSAGVLALHDQEPQMRQYYMAKAVGFEIEKPKISKKDPESEQEIWERLEPLLEEVRQLLKTSRKPERPKKRSAGKRKL